MPVPIGFLAAEDAVGAPKREGARRPVVFAACMVEVAGLTGTRTAAAVVGARWSFDDDEVDAADGRAAGTLAAAEPFNNDAFVGRSTPVVLVGATEVLGFAGAATLFADTLA